MGGEVVLMVKRIISIIIEDEEPEPLSKTDLNDIRCILQDYFNDNYDIKIINVEVKDVI